LAVRRGVGKRTESQAQRFVGLRPKFRRVGIAKPQPRVPRHGLARVGPVAEPEFEDVESLARRNQAVLRMRVAER